MSYKPAMLKDSDITTIEEPIKQELNNNSKPGKIANCNFTYVRNNPDFGAHIIGILKEGARVEITDDQDPKFYKIKTARFEGYCAKQYVTRGE